jgi:YbbR domain-containing protein
VYWESYGTDPSGEKMNVSLTVVKEVEESGFLRRQAKALKLVRESTPVSVAVDDMSARGSSVSPRAIELDISTLKKGSYIVQLEITVAGQYTVRADHRIEIIAP